MSNYFLRSFFSVHRGLRMASKEFDGRISKMDLQREPLCIVEGKATDGHMDDDVQITCFTEDVHDITLHFQIVHLSKQIYAWIGCNNAKFGHFYAAIPTRPSNTVSVTSLLKGDANNTGSSMARRLVMKTGLSIVLACNIPNDSPILEATAERKLIEKLRSLGYITPVSSTSLDKETMSS